MPLAEFPPMAPMQWCRPFAMYRDMAIPIDAARAAINVLHSRKFMPNELIKIVEEYLCTMWRIQVRTIGLDESVCLDADKIIPRPHLKIININFLFTNIAFRRMVKQIEKFLDTSCEDSTKILTSAVYQEIYNRYVMISVAKMKMKDSFAPSKAEILNLIDIIVNVGDLHGVIEMKNMGIALHRLYDVHLV